MDASPATTAGAGVLGGEHESSPPRHFHASWQENVDDTALTENDSVDITRVVAVDEELLIEEEEQLGFTPQQEMLESFKLLLSGGVAGAFSKTATAPLARLTILYQVRSQPQTLPIVFYSHPQRQLILFDHRAGPRPHTTQKPFKHWNIHTKIITTIMARNPPSTPTSCPTRRHSIALERQWSHHHSSPPLLCCKFLDL